MFVTVTEEHGRVVTRVVGTGVGIPAGDVANVFDRFYRVGTQPPSADGTGLGLAIVKRVAELHGGAVGVDSRYGAGSVFWFQLPAKP